MELFSLSADADSIVKNQDEFDFISFLMFDISGAIRQVTIAKSFVTPKLFKEGIGFDASNFGFAKVDKSDMVAIPDLKTAFVEVKDGYKILHTLCDVRLSDGSVFDQYPRTITMKTTDMLRSSGFADDAKFLLELEFFVFDEVSYASTYSKSFYEVTSSEGIGEPYDSDPRFLVQKGYHRISPHDKFFTLRNDIVTALESLNIPVKYHHHEVATAQLEIEMDFMNLQDASDKVCLAKWIASNIAQENGLHITFMPKPVFNMAGSGMHVHQFLEKKGKTCFAGSGLHGLSEEALSYTAGILDHSLTGALLAFSNPSTNSFKRLVPGFEAPVCATLAKGSREASIRIPGYLAKGEERIEFRTGDATANIHYFLSAMVLAGLDGMMKKRDPVKEGYTEPHSDKHYPLDLNAVLDGLEKDNEFLMKVFPKTLIELWVKLKRTEAGYVYHAPTPQEYELYFNC